MKATGKKKEIELCHIISIGLDKNLSIPMILLSTLNLIMHLSDLWQQLELASKLESDLQDTVDWGRKWLVDFSAGKTQLVSFDPSNNSGAIDVKMDGSVLEEN